jgi:hypothetical protein
MAPESKLRQKRRGDRVFIRIPVQLKAIAQDGGEISEPAEAVVISRFGALLRATSLLKDGSALTVTHGFSKQTERFRVVWIADEQTEGCWDIGIEADDPREDFWGIRFPPRERKA